MPIFFRHFGLCVGFYITFRACLLLLISLLPCRVLHSSPMLTIFAAAVADLLQVRVLCNGLVETLGRMTIGDWKQPFTAHPKLDSETGGGKAGL